MNGTFDTHYNYGRPFRVVVRHTGGGARERVVSVYERAHAEDGEPIQYKDDPIISTLTDDVRIGKSPKTRATTFSGGYGPKFDGNSILYRSCESDRDRKHGLTYVFVGGEIIKFRARSPIVEFVSPVGNNDLPYAYAVDGLGNTYLLAEGVVLSEDRAREGEDIYDFYYRARCITEVDAEVDAEAEADAKSPPMELFRGIRHFWIGGDKMLMSYDPRPEESYELLTTDPDAKLYITLAGTRTKRRLRKEKYCELLRAFGVANGFSSLDVCEPID